MVGTLVQDGSYRCPVDKCFSTELNWLSSVGLCRIKWIERSSTNTFDKSAVAVSDSESGRQLS